MPLELQAKLLRALETKEVERLGGTAPIPVDARILAATHQDLGRAVQEGRFRQDLFFRLNVMPLAVPPLRERPEDLLPLARAFAAEIAGPQAPLAIAPGAELALRAYRWPGNVRELRNHVERLNLLRGDGPLTLTADGLEGPAPLAPRTSRPTLSEKGYREHVEDFERELIRAALEEGGSIAGAARLLRMDRGNLYRRIKALGLPLS
jgi:two-component system, NtrC family, nitrogen regulation response regulator NtrX